MLRALLYHPPGPAGKWASRDDISEVSTFCQEPKMSEYLSAGRFIDSDAPGVVTFAQNATAGARDDAERIKRLYHAVRDGIAYDPYVDLSDPANFRASSVLAPKRGFCIGKAALLAAAARVLGIAARVGYADVRNHMTSRRLYEKIKTDVFAWHSYADIALDKELQKSKM